MLVRTLPATLTTTLLAPRPDGALAAAVVRWPRARLATLLRDVGALAYAPVIRAEVRREPVPGATVLRFDAIRPFDVSVASDPA